VHALISLQTLQSYLVAMTFLHSLHLNFKFLQILNNIKRARGIMGGECMVDSGKIKKYVKLEN